MARTTVFAVVRSLRRYRERVHRDLKAEVEASLARAYARQQELCAVDKGTMKRLTRHELADDGLGYILGWVGNDFFAEGLDFYPPFPELGTLHQEAQPSLLPAMFEEEPVLSRRVAEVLR